jgi:hypothetical protein
MIVCLEEGSVGCCRILYSLPYYDVCDTFKKEVSPGAIYIEYCTWFYVFCDAGQWFTMIGPAISPPPAARALLLRTYRRIPSLSEMFLPAHRTIALNEAR